jgi:tRNA threonylcarbamoyl adenosine modification protein YjeE
VASPSFTLVREHANTGDGPGLVHADLYRLRRPAEVADLGLDEYLDDPAVLAVEWPDRGIEVPAARCLVVEFAADARGRTITISADGALPCAVLTGLAETADGVPT